MGEEKKTKVASLAEAFQETASESPDAVALRTPGGEVEITWREYAERVRTVAAGLAGLGVGRGDAVALMLANRPEFNICDTAALHLGATPFSVYNTYSAEQIAHLFADAGNRVVVCEQAFAPVVHEACAGCAVEQVVCIDATPAGTVALAEVEAGADPEFDFEAAWRAVESDDVLTLIYTSGTTGPPKGVELTHANMIAEMAGTTAVLPVEAGDRTTSYLPAAHIADRWISHYHQLLYGVQVTCVADARAVAAALPDVRPTVWGAVPRIWEKMMAALQAGGITDPAALPEEAKAGVRAKLGLDQARWLISGAAPIPVEVLEFFAALGLEICEGWGMSELCAIATMNPPGETRIGTVGKALPGVELRLAEDGELLVRGGIVMKGYRNQPEKTAETVDDEGWVATGDIAEIDSDGYVRIVDRKKELIINAAGKNMSPANIEAKIKAASPLIGQAVCIGDRRPYNVALIVLDPDVAAGRSAEDPEIAAELEAAVAGANEALARVEQIKRFKLLAVEWEPGGDELTPTMKLKRKPIADKYAAEIEALYAD